MTCRNPVFFDNIEKIGKKSRSKTLRKQKERQRKAVETATRVHKAIS